MSTSLSLEEKSYSYTHHCILIVLCLFSFCDLEDIPFTPLNYMLVTYTNTIQAHEV